MMKKNLFALAIGVSLLSVFVLAACSRGAPSQGTADGENFWDQKTDLQTYIAPTQILRKSVGASSVANSATLAIPNSARDLVVYIPYTFNSGQARTILVSKPVIKKAGCEKKRVQVYQFEEEAAYTLETLPSRGVSENWYSYGKRTDLGNMNTQHTLAIAFTVAKECLNLSYEFKASFDQL